MACENARATSAETPSNDEVLDATACDFLATYIFTLSFPIRAAMSDLRRRIFGVGTPGSTPSVSRDASPAPERRDSTEGKGEDLKVISAKKLETLQKKLNRPGRKRRNAWVFGLGGLFGIFLAGFFASSNGGLDKLVDLAGLSDLKLDSILDVLPMGLIKDIQAMQVSSPANQKNRYYTYFSKLMLM